MSAVEHGDSMLGALVGGRYRILRSVGTGAIASVFAAEQVDSGETVALKLVHESFMQKLEMALRFENEAQALMRASTEIDSPHVVRVIDFGMDPTGSLYIAMELLEGEVLRRKLDRDGPVPVTRAIEIATDVAAALAAAHATGVVHGDLEADNVFVLADGSVKVLDFGVATANAPPQTIEPPADLCALGVLINEMITGPSSLDQDDAKTPPRGMSLRRPDLEIPSELDDLVRALLAEEEMSAAAAYEVLRALRDAKRAPPVEHAPAPEVERPNAAAPEAPKPEPPASEAADARAESPSRVSLPLGAPPPELASLAAERRWNGLPLWIGVGGAAIGAVVVALVVAASGKDQHPAADAHARGTQHASPAPGPTKTPAPPEQEPPPADEPVAEPAEPAVEDGAEGEEAVEAAAERARLRITSVPSALVVLDGEATSRRTPTHTFRVVPGLREITLRTDDGREHTVRMELVPGELHTLDHVF